MAKKTVSPKAGVVIAPCKCANDYQDARYGKGRRVHNLTPKGAKTCTVCGTKTL